MIFAGAVINEEIDVNMERTNECRCEGRVRRACVKDACIQPHTYWSKRVARDGTSSHDA